MKEHFHITMFRKLDDGREIECHVQIEPELWDGDIMGRHVIALQRQADILEKENPLKEITP